MIDILNQCFVVAQGLNFLLVMQKFLSLHPLPQNIKRIGCQLTNGTEASNSEVHIPLGVALRPLRLD